MASLDITLTGLEERVTKMEARADVINEVGALTPRQDTSLLV